LIAEGTNIKPVRDVVRQGIHKGSFFNFKTQVQAEKDGNRIF